MKTSRRKHSKGVWLIGSLLYVVVLNYPFVLIFNQVKSVFGIPLIILYLLGGWLLFIVIIILFVRSLNGHDEEESSEGGEQEKQP